MALQPKCARYSGSIDAGLVPPHGFIPAAMHLAMMTTAERDRELIAPFSAQSRWLCKPEMMRIGGTATANKAWLFSDRFHMLPVTNSTRHGERQDSFIDTHYPISPSAAPSWSLGLLRGARLVRHKGREP
jgi:hypothetical protein